MIMNIEVTQKEKEYVQYRCNIPFIATDNTKNVLFVLNEYTDTEEFPYIGNTDFPMDLIFHERTEMFNNL